MASLPRIQTGRDRAALTATKYRTPTSAARKSGWQFAREIHGAAAATVTDWDPDSDVRAQVRRLVEKARFLMRGGYLELAAGLRPRL